MGDAEFSSFLHAMCTVSPAQAWTLRHGCTLALASVLRHASGRVSSSQALLQSVVGCLKARAKDDKVRNDLLLSHALNHQSSLFSLLIYICLSMCLSNRNVYQVPVREAPAQAMSRLLVSLVQERVSPSSVGEVIPVLCSLLTDSSSDVRRRALRSVKALAKVSTMLLLLILLQVQLHNRLEENVSNLYLYLGFS